MSPIITIASIIIIIVGVVELIRKPDMEHKTLTIIILALLAIFTALNALGI
ncbi:hypothetical protein [Methanobrevibacter thaueri]|uniref:Uncharacterized protein n=1 Tax=Methanobrevibacter thaueri TaxID=190975 RepID=A0A315XQ94_9EURY|nr:hypothetical protein [Methanobrevibacter thaueri]PWB88094.1 hypothetical protein MBBTH_02380 [Methanobrevibacter thaueri]